MAKLSRKNLFIISMVICAASLSFLFVFFFLNSNNLEQNITSVEKQEMGVAKNSFKNQFKSINDTALYFSTINISDILFAEEGGYLYFNKGIMQNINMFLSTEDVVNSISISSKGTTFYSDFSGIRNLINDDFEELAVIHNMTLCRTKDDANNKGSNVILRLLENGSSLRNTVYIDINTYLISKSIFETNEFSKKFIVTSNGEIIFSDSTENLGINISDVYSDKINTVDNGSKFNYNGKKYIKYESHIEDTDLKTVFVTNTKRYSKMQEESKRNFVLFFFVVVIVAAASILIILYATYKPIKQLVRSVSRISKNSSYKTNEIEYVLSILENLDYKNKGLNLELEQANREKNIMFQKQMKALQIQMCPHFVYNTLDVINWLAYKQTKDFDNSISVSIFKMSKILREIINSNVQFVSVKKEIELTREYVEIIEIRYFNKIKVTWDVDKDLLDRQIIKFCLQPIIENACVHAFTDKTRDDFEIIISIKKQDGKISVSVADNGVGIDYGKKEELLMQISDTENNRGKHIGLWNLNYRLQILYGKQSSLQIDSTENKGTVFSFVISAE